MERCRSDDVGRVSSVQYRRALALVCLGRDDAPQHHVLCIASVTSCYVQLRELHLSDGASAFNPQHRHKKLSKGSPRRPSRQSYDELTEHQVYARFQHPAFERTAWWLILRDCDDLQQAIQLQ